jgi:nucleotide-binding universal stress UspA family protein
VFDTIVVGVDGYEGGRDALALGALLQRTFGSRLIAVLAYPYDHFASRPSSPAYEAALREDSQQALARELERAGVDAEPVVAADSSPPRAPYDAAERHGAELIVVGSDRHGRVGRVLAGDVTAGTLHGAPCAVAVAPRGLADSQPALGAVALGFDGSPESRAALELARASPASPGPGSSCSASCRRRFRPARGRAAPRSAATTTGRFACTRRP